MSACSQSDQDFGQIAVSRGMITQEKLERGLLLQKCILSRTKIYCSIDKVLKEMGVLSSSEIAQILQIQNLSADSKSTDIPQLNEPIIENEIRPRGLELYLSKDKLHAFLEPSGDELNYSLQQVKELLAGGGVVHGLVNDEAISEYLSKKPLPKTPFQAACGTPAITGEPAEIRYYFEIDPFRIGTLKSDGTMDWKNRGQIPQVHAGDLLSEKTGGKPGQAGINVLGTQIPPPRIKDPRLKCAKGAERSEDGLQVLAKTDGTPKLGPDGRISVLSILSIDGDIGVETGHINFEGYIEAEGAVSSGYTVTGGALRTREIQDATIDLSQDLVCFGGVYGSTIKTGGSLKASHLHNCTIETIGDLIVEKEIFGCTIEVNGRCMIENGKIVASRISAKKGIQVRDVGTEASKPSDLIVGIDHQYEKNMSALKEALNECENQKKDIDSSMIQVQERLDRITGELGRIAQEQDGFMVQKRQFEGQLEGPKAITDEEERTMLKELIDELTEQCAKIDIRVTELMAQEDQARSQLNAFRQSLMGIDAQIKTTKEDIIRLEESLKADPGIAVVKVNGTVFAKTSIAGPHRKMVIPNDMKNVRIAEARSESGSKQWQITISSLR